MPLPKKVVVLDVHPLPRNRLTLSVSNPHTLATYARIVPDIWVSFVDNLVAVGVDFDTTDTHIKAVGGISPEPRNTSLIRRPLARAGVAFQRAFVSVKRIEWRLKPPEPFRQPTIIAGK